MKRDTKLTRRLLGQGNILEVSPSSTLRSTVASRRFTPQHISYISNVTGYIRPRFTRNVRGSVTIIKFELASHDSRHVVILKDSKFIKLWKLYYTLLFEIRTLNLILFEV